MPLCAPRSRSVAPGHGPALFAGGKSFGGRMTSQAQAASPLSGVKGIVFFGFPLHPAGQPSHERGQHLLRCICPMLFLQGTRDKLADLQLLRPLIGQLGERATLEAIEEADHSFHVPARSGRKDAEVLDAMLDNAAAGSTTPAPDRLRKMAKRESTPAPASCSATARSATSRSRRTRRRARRAQAERLSFVVQKHWASRLHYDFRLELDGVLLSWAVPKGPSFDPKEKRMAIHVEDHPLSYGDFEGTIPPKQYGAGTVIVWDRGTWEPVGDPHEGLRDGKLVFKLHGQKLAGLWELVRIAKPATTSRSSGCCSRSATPGRGRWPSTT